MSSRQPRRQGVVYGPPRPPDGGRDMGSILGRILGVLMIVLAIGVLAAGALALMNGSPAATPSRPPTAAPSPGPSFPLPTVVFPSASPSSGPSAGPSASATPFVPIVQVGPGFVTFGTRADSDLNIVDPRSAFRLNEAVTWSAYLSEPADSADLRVRVLKLDPAAAGGERLLSEAGVRPRVEAAQRFERTIRPARVLDGPGVYVVRYLRGETILSEGYFLVEATEQ